MNQRWLNLTGFTTCVLSMAFAIVYLQKTLGLDPCPLCMLDRAVISAVALGFLLAALHNPQSWGKTVYALYNTVLLLLGMGIAGRHIWLQNLPPEQVPSCGADFDYMWENWPLGEMLQTILKGSGDCAENLWTFLGLSIPEQVMLLLIALQLLTILAWLAKPHQK